MKIIVPLKLRLASLVLNYHYTTSPTITTTNYKTQNDDKSSSIVVLQNTNIFPQKGYKRMSAAIFLLAARKAAFQQKGNLR